MRHSRHPSLLLFPLVGTLVAGCPARPPQTLEAGLPPGAFHAPQGIAATSRHVLVVSTAFHFEEGRPAYAPGWLTVIDRRSRAIVRRLPLSGINPQHLAVYGERALVVSSGPLHLDADGVGSAAGEGALELFDFSAGLPSGPAAKLVLPRASSDPRIGAYGRVALSPDGRRAFLGSGTRGDVFVVNLEDGLRLQHGPQDPLALFPTPAGKNGLTTPLWFGKQLAVIDFNSDSLCLIADPAGALADRRCQSIGAYPDLLEGPLDLAPLPGGELLVLMNIANALYRVIPSAPAFTVEGGFARTGLAPNRLLVEGGYAYVVNSLSNNLQRIELQSRGSELPFAVLPVGSNPYDLCITREPEGLRGWVTLQASNQVALVDLESGKLLELLPGQAPLDGGADRTFREAGGPDSGGLCGDGGAEVVGIGNVVQLKLGPGGGAGQEKLPGVVQGPPGGPGSSGDVLSLGVGGEIVVDFGDYDMVDGPGPDFIVFENPFLVGPYQPYAEPAVVGLSTGGLDAASFADLPCDLTRPRGDPVTRTWPYPGCAGVRPVLAGKGSCRPAGGDAFDLKDWGLQGARYLRLRDAGISSMGENTKGFDLDAVVLIHYTRR